MHIQPTHKFPHAHTTSNNQSQTTTNTLKKTTTLIQFTSNNHTHCSLITQCTHNKHTAKPQHIEQTTITNLDKNINTNHHKLRTKQINEIWKKNKHQFEKYKTTNHKTKTHQHLSIFHYFHNNTINQFDFKIVISTHSIFLFHKKHLQHKHLFAFKSYYSLPTLPSSQTCSTHQFDNKTKSNNTCNNFRNAIHI